MVKSRSQDEDVANWRQKPILRLKGNVRRRRYSKFEFENRGADGGGAGRWREEK